MQIKYSLSFRRGCVPFITIALVACASSEGTTNDAFPADGNNSMGNTAVAIGSASDPTTSASGGAPSATAGATSTNTNLLPATSTEPATAANGGQSNPTTMDTLPAGGGAGGASGAVGSTGGANVVEQIGGMANSGPTEMGGAMNLGGALAVGGSDATGGTGNLAGAASTAMAGSSGVGGMGAAAGGAGSTTLPIMAGGDSKCATSSAALCDGFEGPAIGEAGSAWTAETAGGSTISVDTTKPYRGTKSAHLIANKAQAFITETETFAVGGPAETNNEKWGRMFVWYEMDGDAVGHFVFIRAENQADAAARVPESQLHIAGGYRSRFAAEIRVNSDQYKYATPDITIPQTPAKWQCWEWHTTAQNTLDFYIDGEMVPGMSVSAGDNWPFPNIDKLYLGFLQFSAAPSVEMWIDEVAVSDTQVGCDN